MLPKEKPFRERTSPGKIILSKKKHSVGKNIIYIKQLINNRIKNKSKQNKTKKITTEQNNLHQTKKKEE
jgi:hypothetical protein